MIPNAYYFAMFEPLLYSIIDTTCCIPRDLVGQWVDGGSVAEGRGGGAPGRGGGARNSCTIILACLLF
jgi:hypothetical protein